MIKKVKKQVEKEVPYSIVCDKCKKEFIYDIGDPEIFEFVSLKDEGGYYSVIGDMVEWSLDLCQHCFMELCGNYIRKKDPNDDYISKKDLD